MSKQTANPIPYDGDIHHAYNTICPWSNQPIEADSLIQYQGVIIGFSCMDFRDRFMVNPNAYPDIVTMINTAHQAIKMGSYRPPLRWFGRRIGARFSAKDQVLLRDALPKFQIQRSAGEKLNIHDLFPDKPIWLEIGFGGGEHLFEQAKKHPDIYFIGCEPFLTGVASLLKKIQMDNIQNIRIWADDARVLLNMLPDSTIEKLFILFADPWPKRRHQRRRFINGENLDALSKVLTDDGQLIFGSDHKDYIPWAVGQILRHPNFTWLAKKTNDWLCEPEGHVPTRYQQKAEQKGDICRFIIARHNK